MGEIFALLTAMMWGVAVILFKKSGEKVHPIALGLFKNALAALLFMPTAWVLKEDLLYPAPLEDYLLLVASGVLGLAVSDTMFFRGLNLMGASRFAVVDCLYSPFIVGLSLVFLSETLGPVQVAGAAVIVAAVLLVGIEKPDVAISRRHMLEGIFWGAMAMLTIAVSIVMVKRLLERSPLLWVSEVRMVAGVFGLLVMLAVHPNRRKIMGTTLKAGSRRHTIWGSLIGTYVCMIFWLAGMKYAQASIASALNQTSAVFVFILAALFLKERITGPKLAGIILGFGGVLLVTFG